MISVTPRNIKVSSLELVMFSVYHVPIFYIDSYEEIIINQGLIQIEIVHTRSW